MVVALVANENWYKYMVIEVYSLLETTKDVKKVYHYRPQKSIGPLRKIR